MTIREECPTCGAGRNEETDSLYAALSEARSRVETLERERDEARDWVRRLHAETQVLTCVFCGESYPPGTAASGEPALLAHVEKCPKHPLAAARRELDTSTAEVMRLRGLLETAVATVPSDHPNTYVSNCPGWRCTALRLLGREHETHPAFQPMNTATPASPQPAAAALCIIGQRCERHDFVHGWEAEHLRQEFERYADKHDLGWLRRILDEVDARDSLAYIEAVKAEDPPQPRRISRTLAARPGREVPAVRQECINTCRRVLSERDWCGACRATQEAKPRGTPAEAGYHCLICSDTKFYSPDMGAVPCPACEPAKHTAALARRAPAAPPQESGTALTAMDVACPVCGAQPREKCRLNGNTKATPHLLRWRRAKATPHLLRWRRASSAAPAASPQEGKRETGEKS